MENRELKISGETKRVVAINDMSCFGKCSLTVALPVLSAFGVEAVPLPTAILSTHTGGFTDFTCLDMTDEMEKIIAHWKTVGFRCDGIYTGYCLNRRQLELCAEFVKEFITPETFVLVDPVMGDNGTFYHGFDAAFAEDMAKLCSVADVITPNITEAFLLTKMEYAEIQTEDIMEECLKRLSETGAKRAVVTGVRPDAERIGYVCRDFMTGQQFDLYYPMEDIRLHGCGDVFASILCGETVKGKPLSEAVRIAGDFTEKCIKTTETDLENHWYGLKFEKNLMEGLPE